MEELDNDKINYVFTYFGYLMTENERMAWSHYTCVVKMEGMTVEKRTTRTGIYLNMGWMTDKREVLSLLDNGINLFKENAVRRILTEKIQSVHFNTCPRCGQLARTPHAKQCRCGHSWRE